jgi:anti-sigma B factor antagonist
MSVEKAFAHVRLSKVDDVVVIEILIANVQGPILATQFSEELMAVANEKTTDPILLDMSRCIYFSSMGYAGLFKLVKRAGERQRRIKFCNMHPDVKVGADIIGLYHVVDIYDSRESALEAFGHA